MVEATPLRGRFSCWQSGSLLYSQKLLKVYADKQEEDRRQGYDCINFTLKDQELALTRQRLAYNARITWLTGIACGLSIVIILLLWRNGRRNRRTHLLLQQQYADLAVVSSSLEKRNGQYVKLLKIVAHDLRNPIGAIMSASEMVTRSAQQEQPLMGLIRKASTQCLQLIGELLETDLEAGPESLCKERVPADELVSSVAALLQFKAREKGQLLELDAATGVVVEIDKRRMGRVIDNLVVNAIKFSPNGARIVLSVNATAAEVILGVKDEGIGIPPALAAQLFDPFTPSKRKGTAGEPTFGLGLSICKQIVEAHGGHISFQSNENRGTIFFVRLARVG